MGADGHTAYQRVKGRAFSRNLAQFGECVWFLKPKTAGINKADIGGMTESGSASTTTPGKHTWALNQELRRSEPSAGRALRRTDGMRRNCEAPRDPHGNQWQEEKVHDHGKGPRRGVAGRCPRERCRRAACRCQRGRTRTGCEGAGRSGPGDGGGPGICAGAAPAGHQRNCAAVPLQAGAAAPAGHHRSRARRRPVTAEGLEAR